MNEARIAELIGPLGLPIVPADDDVTSQDRESLVVDMADFIHDRRAELGWHWYALDYGDELHAIAERVVDYLSAQRSEP